MTSETEPQRRAGRPPAKQATFRMPRTAIVAAVLAMVSGTPLAWSSWWLTPVYLLPIGFIVWVLRTQTSVDADGITARTLVGKRVVRWEDLTRLSITSRAKVRAVTGEDEVPLPGVRVRHLPVLAAFSGGRIGEFAPPPPAKPKQAAAEKADDADSEQPASGEPSSDTTPEGKPA